MDVNTLARAIFIEAMTRPPISALTPALAADVWKQMGADVKSEYVYVAERLLAAATV